VTKITITETYNTMQFGTRVLAFQKKSAASSLRMEDLHPELETEGSWMKVKIPIQSSLEWTEIQMKKIL